MIEARRSNGLPVARYRMGTRPEAGNFYMLAISVEEVAPVSSPVAVLTNEMLRIVGVSNAVGQAQASFQIAERGQVMRLGFGTVPLSGFDAWASERGLPAGSGQLDADGDGFSNLQEYVAGTDPTNPESHFSLLIAQTVSAVEVAFLALRAEGTGYANQTRYYSLKARPVWRHQPTLGSCSPVSATSSAAANPSDTPFLRPTRPRHFSAVAWNCVVRESTSGSCGQYCRQPRADLLRHLVCKD